MERSSDSFLETRRSCVSCHHQNLPSVALGWARDRGFAINEASLARMVDRQLDGWSRRINAAYEMDRPFPVPPQLLGYGLWGFSAIGQLPDAVTDATVWYLAETQKPDGRWVAGAVVRPPMGGEDILSTALAVRSLQAYPLPGRRAEMKTRIDRARHWLSASRPAVHQELVYKLLGLAWAGASADELRDDVERLLAAQQPDGGWAQLVNLPSDAWATGQSLVALRVAGQMPVADTVYQRGIDFLLRTQFEDGSWYVQSRAWPFQPPFESGFPFGRDQWISVGATAWATMALLLTVEPTEPSVVPSRNDPRPSASVGLAPPPAPTKPADEPAPAKPPAQPVDFARDIKPLLVRSCAGCHSGEIPQGEFRVTERALLLRGGESSEAAVVPGKSEQSPLFARVSTTDPDLAMPPLKKRDKFPALSKDELAAIRAWIDQGAPWPADVAVQPAAE